MKKAKIDFKNDQMVIHERSYAEKFYYKEILCITYDAPYVKLRKTFGRDKLFFYSLKELITQLPEDFFICRRSAIINRLHVTRYHTKNKITYVTMRNGEQIPVSRLYKNNLARLLAIQ